MEDRDVTICYNYDSNGNILSKVFYPYTTGTLTSATQTISYNYAVSWGDQLLTYNNGSIILYDQIGNPLSYNGYTFTWQKGRQLASATKEGETFNFVYNADGQRTWKVGSTTGAQYTYASGLLVSMTDGTNTLNFTYDPDGIALGVNLNGTDYYYLYNAQGDVIALYDGAGTVVTEYKYDSWGKLLSTTGSAAATIGLLNPLRYRGYFYDTDLGFYLLETRYYDPETGRFINADGVVDTRHVNTNNLYSYCINDPINLNDVDGGFPVHIAVGIGVGFTVGAIAGALSAKSSGRDGKGILLGALRGGAVGAAIGFVCSVNPAASGVLSTAGRMVGSAVLAGAGNISKQRYDYKHPVSNKSPSNKKDKQKAGKSTKSVNKAKSVKTVSKKVNTSKVRTANTKANPVPKTFKESINWKEVGSVAVAGGLSAGVGVSFGSLLLKELSTPALDAAAYAASSLMSNFGISAGESVTSTIIQLYA